MIFSTSSNRARHERNVHMEYEETPSINFDLDEDYTDTEEDNGIEVDDDQESDASEDDFDEDEYHLWERLIREACANCEDIQITSADQMLEMPYLEQFLEKLRSVIEDYIGMATWILEDSEVYNKLNSTIFKLYNEGYSEKEAISAAWEQRKHLLKRLINKYTDVIEEKLFD